MLPAAPRGERAGGGGIAQWLRNPFAALVLVGAYRSRPLRPPSFSPNTSPSEARPEPWLRMYSR